MHLEVADADALAKSAAAPARLARIHLAQGALSEAEEAVEHARALQERVRAETGLSASLGVAQNKLVAKVASDRDKPGGLTVVQPGEEAAFLFQYLVGLSSRR